MIKIPFAGFVSFQDCVNKQMAKHRGEKGFTIENAKRICGAIQARVEGSKKLHDPVIVNHPDYRYKVFDS